MRWACLLLPQLAIDGVLRRRAGACADPEENLETRANGTPLALLAGPAQRRLLHSVTPAARALGLRPGLSLAAAQALAAGFETAEYDPDDARHWRDFLAAWAYGFSSQV